jgi:protein-tyrosine phosphatase
MDEDNFYDLKELAKQGNGTPSIHLLREFDHEADGALEKSVPDPYYAGKPEFEEVYRIIERSVSGFVDYLEDNNQ